MIQIEEIPVENINEFWNIHMQYLTDDILIDDEDKEYFGGDEYRNLIQNHMTRQTDRHHMVYFVRNDIRIGAAQYTTYQSEDGKCFILDYWIFPAYRGNGTGHRCFETLREYTMKDGALYYELNAAGNDARRIRFWKSLGFVENGVDEYGVELLKLCPTTM